MDPEIKTASLSVSGVPMDTKTRERFDRLLEEVIEELPPELRVLLEEVPVVVDDRASRRTAAEAGVCVPRDLCGLYTGIPLTRRSVHDSGVVSDEIHLFRGAILSAAQPRRRRRHPADAALKREIRITLLHEMGHHFGLDEDDLREAGYQ